MRRNGSGVRDGSRHRHDHILRSIQISDIRQGFAQSAERIRIQIGDQAVNGERSPAARPPVIVFLRRFRCLSACELFARYPGRFRSGPWQARTTKPGDLGYWRPGGNFVIFYRHDGLTIPSPGIVVLGQVNSSKKEQFDVPWPSRSHGRADQMISKPELRIRMNPIYDFKGQVALVTGAAKGMGLATARMFAESGAAIVLADLDGDLAAKEAERITVAGGAAMHRLRCGRQRRLPRWSTARSQSTAARHGVQQCRDPGAAVDAADGPIQHFERVTAVNHGGSGAA